MAVTIEKYELIKMMADTIELGANRALIEAGLLRSHLSGTQANKKYGESNVRRWIAGGLITPLKDGNKNSAVRLDRIQLDIVAKSSNRINYFRLQD